MPRDEQVRARMFLGAVLPALETLSQHDSKAASLAASWDGSIFFRVALAGPKTTLKFLHGHVEVFPSQMPGTDIRLFFPTHAMLSRLFTGKTTLPVLYRGVSRIKGLITFMRLAQYLEQVLDGQASDTITRSTLMLGIMTRSLVILAEHETASRELRKSLSGIAEFRITDTAAMQIDFSSEKPLAKTGGAHRPDFIIEFRSPELFLQVAQDKVDVMAQVCLETILLKGDLHMGQAITVLLDKIGSYLHEEVR